MYKTIKKFLAEGGKCLLIEDGKPIGVVLTVEEYEKLKETPAAKNPIGEAITKEMDFPEASPPKADQPRAGAEIADIEAVDDITLKDLGIDELPY